MTSILRRGASDIHEHRHEPCGAERYTLGKSIGEGKFGRVCLGYDKVANTRVAVKMIRRGDTPIAEYADKALQEINAMQNVSHPNILHFRDWFVHDSNYFIVTDLAVEGELFAKLGQVGHFSEKDTVRIMKQVMAAVAYLDNKGIVHRDIKPENILLFKDRCVLADFGVAEKLVSPHGRMYSRAGTPGYTAPEMYNVDQAVGYGKECDVWSLGIVAYVLLSGRFPFPTAPREQFLKEVYSNKQLFPDRYFGNVSEYARHFITCALSVVPETRWTVQELSLHPWLHPNEI